MLTYQTDTLLIITKTYPSPSKKYRETTCVAAINKKGKLRRLFPIPFRLLGGEFQFKRWEWIEAGVAKADKDHRPESYKLDTDSIIRHEKVGTESGWAERYYWIEPHIMDSFEQLEARRQNSGETLGFIRPNNCKLIITKADNPDWTEEETNKLIQDGLFDPPEVKKRFPLRKVPYDFYYEYECQNKSESYTYQHKIIDWEVCSLYWNCQELYGSNWEIYFRQKLEIEFSKNKDLIFLMGTIHRFPDQWLIVGLIYPPKTEARQRPLFSLVPDA